MTSALVFALLVAATQVSFLLRKPHFSFIVDLYSFLRAREPPLSLIRLYIGYLLATIYYCILAIYWLLPVVYWLLAIGYWQLAIVYWLLPIGYWLLPIAYCLLAIGYALSSASCLAPQVQFWSCSCVCRTPQQPSCGRQNQNARGANLFRGPIISLSNWRSLYPSKPLCSLVPPVGAARANATFFSSFNSFAFAFAWSPSPPPSPSSSPPSPPSSAAARGGASRTDPRAVRCGGVVRCGL
jgi:hypothetical protein